MATPMTLAQMRKQLRKFGVPFEVVGNPNTHRRDPGRGSWGPVNGFLVHHTGDDAPDTADLRVITQGRSDLPGPLANFGLWDNGKVSIVSVGRANHAGNGDRRVFDALVAEAYGNYPPQPSSDSVDGNARLYGVETFYSGAKAPTKAARRSLVLLAAAICDHHGWSAKSVIGHKEWTRRKPDPGNVDMAQLRREIQAAIDAANAVDCPPPAPVTTRTPADPIEGWKRMIPIRDRLADLAKHTANKGRRRRISAALDAIEGK